MTIENVLLQYGAVGVLALAGLIATRLLFTQVAADKQRETDRADRNETALRELNVTVQEKVIPAALDMVSTTKALIELVADLQAEKRRQR